MSNPYPTPEALKRLHSLGEKAISGFIDEVSPGSIRNIVSFLPSVAGFRKTSQVGIQQRKRTLARQLVLVSKDSSGSLHQREYEALYVLWRAWGLERLGDAEKIEELLSKIEDLEEQKLAAREKAKTDTTDIDGLFWALRDLSRENKCSREQIERFFTFSPFSQSDGIARAIADSKSGTDVDRDAAFTDVPERIQQTEQEIQSLKAQIRSVTDRIDAIPDMSGAVDALARRINALSDAAEALRQSISGIETDLKTSQDGNHAIKASLGYQAKELAKITAQVAENAREQKNHQATINDALRPVTNDIQSLAVSLEALVGKIPTDEWRADLEAKVEKACAAAGNASPLVQPREPPPRISNPSSSRVRLEPLWSGDSEAKDIVSAEDIAAAIALNLQSIGLKTSAADTFSEEITAAIAAGQAVFFRGAFSSEVARLCALSLSGEHAYRCAIPVGLDDGEQLRHSAREALAKSEDHLSSIFLEGVNRSELELFEDVLLELSSGLQASLQSRRRQAFVFASLLSGAAALPIEMNYLQLGPVFDLDYLDWRSRAPVGASLILGTITPKVLETIQMSPGKGTQDEDEIVRLIAKGDAKRHPQLERAVLSAYRALAGQKSASPHPTALQSLAYGWLAPLWLVRGVSRDDFDEEFLGGKVDADRPDPRLSLLLQATDGNARVTGEAL